MEFALYPPSYTMTAWPAPVTDLFASTEDQGQFPIHQGGIYVNRIPARPTIVPLWKPHEQFASSNGAHILNGIARSHQRLQAAYARRTANANRFSGNSSNSLTFPTYSGPGDWASVPLAGSVNGSMPVFLQQPVFGMVPLWAALGFGVITVTWLRRT